jgi:hypothetical protein
MTDYKVKWYIDDEWEVVTLDNAGYCVRHFKGSLADCEAWIRLTESGHLY